MTTEHPQQPQENAGHSRRRFLAAAGATVAGGAAGATVLGPAAGAAAAPSGKRVAVLGGGVSGLSAAHELAERGYAVTVYEYYDALGGKARSMDVPGTAAGGRRPLPAEHGFRFFPGFYRNLPDTMRRIPFPGNANGVHDNLRSGTEALFARGSGRPDLHFPLRRVTTPPAPGDITPAWLRDQILSVLDLGTRLPAHEAAYFADRLLVHLTSCDARREDQWEKTPWWDFIRAGEMSAEYQVLLGIGQTRNLVATRAEIASTLPQALGFARAGRCPHGRPRHHRGPAAVGPARPRHGRRRRRRPRPQRPDQRGLDRSLGDVSALARCGVRARHGSPGRGLRGRPGDRRPCYAPRRRRGAHGHRRPLRLGDAGRARPRDLGPGPARGRPAARAVRRAEDGLDDRRDVLSAHAHTGRARAHQLPRLTLGGHRHRPVPVLGRTGLLARLRGRAGP